MRVSFRQGIVRCLDAGFLTVGPHYVSLNVLDTPTVITLAHGSTDYLFVEQRSAINAWGPITPGVDQWLYWDISTSTAERTFGITKLRPIIQANPPQNPANDQHWFNTSTGTMNVWNAVANRWVERIRVFACELNDGAVPLSMSANSPDFKGTQVGITQSCLAGVILKDVATGKPLKTSDNKFLTGETKLQAITGATSNLRTEAIILEAEAQENMPAYTIVRFVDHGKIVAANQFTVNEGEQFGIIESDANIGDIVTVTTTGVITNPVWGWATVNTLLYSSDQGQISTTPVGNSSPIGIVIDVNKILLFAASRGRSGGEGTADPATTTQLGTVRLSVPAVDPNSPVVVGDNDPRIVNALSKTGGVMTGPLTLSGAPTLPDHAATKAYVDAHTPDLSTVVAKAGDTMTGPLTLPADPTLPLQAATKQYVDTTTVSSAGDTMTGPLILSQDPTNALGAATKQYVDAAASTAGTAFTKVNNDTVLLQKCRPVQSSGIGMMARADANSASTSDIIGLVVDAEVAVGASGRVQTAGILTATTGEWDAVTEQAGGLTEGSVYYLNVAPSGRLTTIPPSTPGQYLVIVGVALSSTQLFINTQASILL